MSRGLLFRLGLVLCAPQRAAESLAAGAPGGLRDVLYLLPLRLLTGESALFLSGDPRSMLLGALSALSIDLLGIFLGGVVMSLLIGRSERQLRAGLCTDLAANGWFGWLGVQVLFALGFMAAQRQPGQKLSQAISVLSLAVFFVYFGIGFFVARRTALAAEAAPENQPPKLEAPPVPARAPFFGGLFMVALLTLSAFDVVWIYKQQKLRPRAGREAPEIVVRKLDKNPGTNSGGGGEFHLSAERGHPVLVDFWATWCIPCRQSLPLLDGVYKRLEPRGLRVIAVDNGESEAVVRSFVNRLGLEMPVGLDSGEVADRYGVTSIPHMVLIGSDGQIKKVFRGVHSEQEIEAAVLAAGL